MHSSLLSGPASHAPFVSSMRSTTSRRFWSNQRAGASFTVLVMLGMLLASPIFVVLGGQGIAAQVGVEVTFDRWLSGDRVGQHKVPPLTSVTMTITAIVSSQVENAALADYFPSDWTVTNANGGIVSIYDENYNKIEWNVGAVSDSVSRFYVVRSPQRTLPSTKYYFHSELIYQAGSATSGDWMVIVADPPDTVSLYVNAYDARIEEWTTVGSSPYLSTQNEPTDYVHINAKTKDIGDFSFADLTGSPTIISVTLYLYCDAGSEKISVYVWDSSISDWSDPYTFQGTGWAWRSIDVTATLDTDAKVDAAKIYLASKATGGWGGTVQADAAYLYVDYSLVPNKPVLVSPENNYQTSDNTPTFTWENGANATYHRLVIDNSPDFSDGDNIYDNANIYDNTCTIENELPPDNYWWHVAAGGSGIENWSENTRRIEIIPYVPPEWQLIETWTGTVSAPVAWQVIETWTGTVNAPAEWQLIESWTGTVSAPAQWQVIETWTGTVTAPAVWQLIETWTGTVSAPVQWNLIETWTGTVQAPVAWQVIETWTGTVSAPAAWSLIETWTGTVTAPAEWQLIETWTGTVSAPAEWQLIETWTGTVSAPVQWQLIETWMGTVSAPAEWQLIETWTGTVSAPAQWQLIETWTGTVTAPAVWQLIETWTGTVSAPVQWNLIETWTGTVSAPAQWQAIETWTGTVSAPAQWNLIETWTGTVSAPAEWQLVETWTGTVSAPAEWQLIETWTGTVSAPVEWNLIETWTGTVSAPAQWQAIETWTGTVSAPAQWSLIETWTGTVSAPAEWQLIETWTGTVTAPVVWQLIETWTGTVEAPAEWQVIETWTGTVSAPAAWSLIETWTGTVTAPAEWQLIEAWTGTVSAPVEWQLIESWTGTVSAPVQWNLIETWTGTVSAPAQWNLIETWTGTVSAPAAWQLIETWTGTVSAPAQWQVIETWTGTVTAPVQWQLIETWTGTVEAPAAWQVVETWTGTVNAPAAWQVIETWTGTVEAPVVWRLIEMWTGTVEAPAAWQLIESWTGVVEAPAAWQLVESWTGVVEAVGVLSSSVGAISPYWQTSTPFTVTATASDPDGYVENVELFYRYRENSEVSWGSWIPFGLDNENFDGWSWSFTGSDGYYEFYSIARDNDDNVESAPAEADARCGVDTVDPTITSIVINDNADLTSSTSVTLSIDASDVTSGLAEMRFSDDNLIWSDWENFAASKSYTLPTGDGLKTVYVQVKDKAGLVSTAASDSITLETIPPPPEGALTVTIGTITAGTTGSADFTQYAIAVTEVRITAAGTVSNVRVDIVVHATAPAGVTMITLPVYSYFDITTNVGAAEVRGATIRFKVSRSWITQNSIDERTIRLLRYGGGWQALSTSLVGADSTHVYYEATTPGFSLFAVVGERMVAPPVVTPPTAPTPLPAPLPAPPAVPFEFFAMLSMVGALAGFSIAYSLVRPSKYYLMLKRLERAVVRPRRRRVGEPAVRPPVRVRKSVNRAELAALKRLERIARKRKRKMRRGGRKKSASERRR